jgi:leucyl-tRNA synthetase
MGKKWSITLAKLKKSATDRRETKIYKTDVDFSKPKYYVLDMFPYPSVGTYVGHPLGYIASDIYARFKRQKGYNVLHPMDTMLLVFRRTIRHSNGQHPAITTLKNADRIANNWIDLGFLSMG